jgi:hypothetical protein
MLERAGAKNVITKNVDFLSVNPHDPEYSNVTHMYVFPHLQGHILIGSTKTTRSILLWIRNSEPTGLCYYTRFAHQPHSSGLLTFTVEVEDSDSKEDQERLEKLSAFQLKILQHAMKCSFLSHNLSPVLIRPF